MATIASAPVLLTSLKELCVKVVASEFETSPTLKNLPDAYVKKVIASLPLDLPLELVGAVISDETYWKRRANARWKNLEVAAHGNSWKQLYFERNLQDVLENFDPQISDIQVLKRLITFSRRFTHTLHVRQLPSHLDLQMLFDCMVNTPAALSLTYSLKNVGIDYDRSFFGIKLADCRQLARALERTETLTYLDLSSNNMDDDKVRMVASGLVDNVSVTHMNFSHNKVADRGMRSLAKLLTRKSVISMLDLYDNQIHTEGARALAKTIKSNVCLISMNLRLNRMGDEGCAALLDAVKLHPTLERLNISANAAAHTSAIAVAGLLQSNSVLRELDVSCNDLGVEGGAMIRRALEGNTTIQLLDIRSSSISIDDEIAIIENLTARKDRKDRAKVLGGS